MDLIKVLGELRQEKLRLVEAIVTIERLAVGSGQRRRGRPPKWMALVRKESQVNTDQDLGNGNSHTVTVSRKRPVSAATRKRMSEAQKVRWAGRELAGRGSAGRGSAGRESTGGRSERKTA